MSSRSSKIMKLALTKNIKNTECLGTSKIPEQVSTKRLTWRKQTEGISGKNLNELVLSAENLEACRKSGRDALDNNPSTSTDYCTLIDVLHPQGELVLSAEDLEACRKSARDALDNNPSTSTDYCTSIGVLHPQGVKRKLFTSTECVEETAKDLTEIKSGPYVVKEITKRMNIYLKHRKVDFKNGNLNSAKKKNKKIGCLKLALANAKRGEPINLAELPCISESSTPNSVMNTDIPLQDIEIREELLQVSVLPCSSTQNVSGSSNKKKEVRRRHKCLYCDLTPRDYADHVERKHRDTPEGKELKEISAKDLPAIERSTMKRKITSSMTKRVSNEQNSKVLKQDEIDRIPSNISTVKRWTKEKPDANNTVQCKHCLGFYRRDKLWKHIKYNCNEFLKHQDNINKQVPSKHLEALREHSITLQSELLGASKNLITEVLPTMHKDELYVTAINDPLIMKYGSEFHLSRRSEKDRNYVSRECRDLARLFLEIKKIDQTVKSFEHSLSPAHFDTIMRATLVLSKYDPATGVLLIPSFPYRILPALKNATKLAKGEVVSQKYKGVTSPTNCKIKEKTFTDFLEMLNSHWNSRIGRLSIKSRKTRVSQTVKKMPLEEDISKVCEYVIAQYRRLIHKLDVEEEKELLYDDLLSLLVVHIMCLMRRRPVAFKLATIRNYEMMDNTEDIEDMAKQAGLSEEELNECRKFHIFYVLSKNDEIVPIALTPVMKEALDGLIRNRKAVGIPGDKLFYTSNNKVANPSYCFSKIKDKLNLKKPSDLTANGLRHQAATFSKLHSTNPRYQDYLASSLGHSLLVHKKNYELPVSILQKLIVVPTLHGMTVKENSQNLIADAQPKKTIVTSVPEVEECYVEDNRQITEQTDRSSEEEDDLFRASDNNKLNRIKRTKWTKQQRLLVFQHFGRDILTGNCPHRSRVVLFHNKYKHILKRNVSKVYTYIHNISKRKQKIRTPERLFLNNQSRKNSLSPQI